MRNGGESNGRGDFSELDNILLDLSLDHASSILLLLLLDDLIVKIEVFHLLLKIHRNIFFMEFSLANALGIIRDELINYLDKTTLVTLLMAIIQFLQLYQTLVIVVPLL